MSLSKSGAEYKKKKGSKACTTKSSPSTYSGIASCKSRSGKF